MQASPLPELALPAAHGTHAEMLVAPVTPAVSVPGGHLRHSVRLALLYVLAGHGAQLSPFPVLAVPTAHEAHAEMLVRPVAPAVSVPAGQRVHVALLNEL